MKKLRRIIIVGLALCILIISFVPFTSTSHNNEGEFQYCRYRFAVYKFYPIEAEGEGYGPSDTFIGNIELQDRIGGPLEYFGFKKVEYKK